MGGEVVSSYLGSKFSSLLEEAEADPSHPLPIASRFRSIQRLINSKISTENLGSSASIPVDLLHDLIDALSECRIFAHEQRKAAASKKGFYFFRVFLFKKNMTRRLDDIERKLKIITNSPEGNSGTGSSGRVVIHQTSPVLDPSPVLGFESQTKEIEDLLMPNNLAAASTIQEDGEEEEAGWLTAIGIVGRCGCGKTALAQKIFASPRIGMEFDPRIWVCLSDLLFDKEREDPRVRVLNYILREIGHDVSELEYADFSLAKLLEKLQYGLTGKRYLIVLDNAWRMEEWFADLGCRGYAMGEYFTHGLPKGSGGAVIVTSRREDVIRQMVGDKHVIRPEMSNDTCWKIFSDAVRQRGKISPDHRTLIQMKDDVVGNCDGLPLAAKILAIVIPDLLESEVKT